MLTSHPVYATDALADSPIGSYSITPSGGAAANYVFSYVPGVFSVTSTQSASSAPANLNDITLSISYVMTNAGNSPTTPYGSGAVNTMGGSDYYGSMHTSGTVGDMDDNSGSDGSANGGNNGNFGSNTTSDDSANNNDSGNNDNADTDNGPANPLPTASDTTSQNPTLAGLVLCVPHHTQTPIAQINAHMCK